MIPSFSPLSPDWRLDFAAKRAYIEGLAEQRGAHLDRSENDLGVLQQLIDEAVISSQETAHLQALGVVFGDVLAKAMEVDWWLVTDEYGTDPVLHRPGEDALAFGALTILSKRLERGEAVSVRSMYDWAIAVLAERYGISRRNS
jgi:hypothetical protein